MKGVEPASQKSYFHELCELFSRQLKRPDSTEEYKNPACTADTFPEAHDNEMCFMPQINMPGKELQRQVPTGIISLLSLNPCHQHPDPRALAAQGERAEKCLYCKCWLNNPTEFLFAGGFREQMQDWQGSELAISL